MPGSCPLSCGSGGEQKPRPAMEEKTVSKAGTEVRQGGGGGSSEQQPQDLGSVAARPSLMAALRNGLLLCLSLEKKEYGECQWERPTLEEPQSGAQALTLAPKGFFR